MALLFHPQIPGGSREETGLVHGVVFKKNVAHKKMVQKITDPKVLLLQGSIEYQRVENKFSYLGPQILQVSLSFLTSLLANPNHHE